MSNGAAAGRDGNKGLDGRMAHEGTPSVSAGFVTQISGERTLNLGNFESVRFGARVEIPLGGDLDGALDELERVIVIGLMRISDITQDTEVAVVESVSTRKTEEPPEPEEPEQEQEAPEQEPELEWFPTRNPDVETAVDQSRGVRVFHNTRTGASWERPQEVSA